MKDVIEITAKMAAEVEVILHGGPRFMAQCSLVSKGRKVGSETAAVNACNEKQARLAIKRVMEKQVGTGIGVKIISCTVDGQEVTSEEVVAMNTHQQAVKETKEENKMEIKKIALIGETVDYTALAEALKVEGRKLLVGDAMNKEHLNALFRVKGGSFEGVMIQAYLAHKGEKSVYSSEKLGFTPVTLSILSFMNSELRAQFMKEALTNKAFALIGNAPEPQPTPKPEKKEEKKEVTKPQPSLAEIKEQVCSKLVELGYEMGNGQDVVAEINKFGSYAIQKLGIAEAEVNALIQKGVADAKAINEVQEEIMIPDEEPEEEDIVDIISSMMKGGVGSSADIIAYFLSHNVEKKEDAVEAAKDIFGLFSEVHSASVVEGELVIEGVVLRDGNIHKVAVNSELQGRILG